MLFNNLFIVILISSNLLVIEIDGLTSEEKRKMVHDIQNKVDALPFVPYNEVCDALSNDALKKINEKIAEGKEEDMIDSNKALYDRLIQEVSKVEKLNNAVTKDKWKGLICDKDAGQECSSQTNRCKCQSVGIFDPGKRKCFLEENNDCQHDSSPELQISCKSPLACVILSTHRGASLSVPWIICSLQNKRTYNLDSDWPCNCHYPDQEKVNELRKLKDQLLIIPHHAYGDNCDFKSESIVHNDLTPAIESQDPTFYRSDDYNYLFEKLKGATGGLVTPPEQGKPLFCNIFPNNPMTCDERKQTCGCYLSAIYNSTEKKCVAVEGIECGHEGFPYPCMAGEHCLFDEVDVVCSQENKNTTDTLNLRISKDCHCSPRDHIVIFDDDTINRLVEESNEEIRNDVHELNATITEVIPKGSSCNWEHDRKYFQMQDFISAKLEHVFHKMDVYYELLPFKTNGTKIQVCDLKKSMRCGFLSNICECPVDDYISHEIQSTYDMNTDSCHLNSESICYASLSEWLPCIPGEACIYKEVPVLCNRENKKAIIENNITLKSALCKCSNKDYKNVLDVDTIKRFSVKKRIKDDL